MTRSYPPGVTGTEVPIIGSQTLEDRIFDWLNQRPLGSSAEVIARALSVSTVAVEAALALLVESGSVEVVRRTRSSVIYGVSKEEGKA